MPVPVKIHGDLIDGPALYEAVNGGAAPAYGLGYLGRSVPALV
nr:hypothetical protein [Tropicibacter alexandrii]